jgi:hypothetical protein
MPASKALRFFATLAGLAASVFLLDKGLYRLLASAQDAFYRDPAYAVRLKKFMKGKSFDTLILGSSRTYEGIHPAYFEKRLGSKAFKEAYFGRSPYYHYLFYDSYRRLAGRPRVVVYGVDYFMFTTISDKRWLAKFETQPRPPRFFESPSLLIERRKETEDFLNDLRTRLEGGAVGDNAVRTDWDLNKIQRYIGRKATPGRIVTVRPKRYTPGPYFPYPGKEGRFFRRLLDEFARDGVLVLLVTIPDYIGTYETDFERRKFMEDLGRLTEGFRNVRIYDFNRPEIFPLAQVDLFLNGGWGLTNSHLSRKGAALFNRLLLKKIAPLYDAAK